MIRFHLAAALRILALGVAVWTIGASAAAAEPPLAVRLLVSDHEILVGDSVVFKLVVTNQLDSTVLLRDIRSAPSVLIRVFLECRSKGEEEWRVIGEVSASSIGRVQLNVTLAGHEELALKEQFFLDGEAERGFVFGVPGEVEVRIRLTCLLGEFPTEPVTIKVKARPEKELALLHEFRKDVEMYIEPRHHWPHYRDLDKLRESLSGGSTKRTLEMLAKVGTFELTGTVDGQEVTLMEAYERMGKGLNEVRREHLAAKLIEVAFREKQWPALARLLEDFKEVSSVRGTYTGVLREARFGLRP